MLFVLFIPFEYSFLWLRLTVAEQLLFLPSVFIKRTLTRKYFNPKPVHGNSFCLNISFSSWFLLMLKINWKFRIFNFKNYQSLYLFFECVKLFLSQTNLLCLTIAGSIGINKVSKLIVACSRRERKLFIISMNVFFDFLHVVGVQLNEPRVGV